MLRVQVDADADGLAPFGPAETYLDAFRFGIWVDGEFSGDLAGFVGCCLISYVFADCLGPFFWRQEILFNG